MASLGFNEFADQFGIIHPELSGVPGAIRTLDLLLPGTSAGSLFF